jgi:hypothetical protein
MLLCLIIICGNLVVVVAVVVKDKVFPLQAPGDPEG